MFTKLASSSGYRNRVTLQAVSVSGVLTRIDHSSEVFVEVLRRKHSCMSLAHETSQEIPTFSLTLRASRWLRHEPLCALSHLLLGIARSNCCTVRLFSPFVYCSYLSTDCSLGEETSHLQLFHALSSIVIHSPIRGCLSSAHLSSPTIAPPGHERGVHGRIRKPSFDPFY